MTDPMISWKELPPGVDAPEMQPIYDVFVAKLARLGVGDSAPRVGTVFPAFSLPDPRGVHRSLGDIQQGRPLVISFNRGGWCPHCVHELATWGQSLEALHETGAGLLVITGELADGAVALKTLAGGDGVDVLCDVDHGLALACGLAFHIDEDIERRYREAGLDLATVYGSDGGFLPVPATFVLDSSGVIQYAFVDPDFRHRAFPPDVVKFVATLD